MESRAYALITGLFVLGLAGCIVLWAHWLAKTPLARTAYRVVATGAGLRPQPGGAGALSRHERGARHSRSRWTAKDPRRILVDIEVDERHPVHQGHLRAARHGRHHRHRLRAPAGRLQGHGAGDEGRPSGVVEVPLRPAFFDVLSDSAEGAVKDARELMASLNDLLTPENRKRIAATLASLERMSANLEVHALPHVARAGLAVGGEPAPRDRFAAGLERFRQERCPS